MNFLKRIYNFFFKKELLLNKYSYVINKNSSIETQAIKHILNSPKSKGKLDIHSRPKRIRNIGDISIQEFKNIVMEIFSTDVEILDPSHIDNPSQSNYAVKFLFENKVIVIVLGRNKAFGLNVEKNQVNYINNLIKSTNNGWIILKIKDQNYIIKGAKLVKNNKHADFVLYGHTNTLYIQYKNDIGFQQYSGIEFLSNELEVKNFINDIKNNVDKINKKEKYKRNISELLKLHCVYGVDENFNENKINLICFGDIKFMKTNFKNEYIFTSSQDFYVYPEIPRGVHEPIIGVRFASDRSQFGIKNARFGFYPNNHFKTAKEI